MSLERLRVDYDKGELLESGVSSDPMDQFRTWFDEAQAAGLPEPNAMTLATADASGSPSARIVLLKGVDSHGFSFFTNYESRKGRDLAENPRAALVFFWQPLERQVRIEGRVERISEEESDAYFAVRPIGARLGAWSSHQSEVVPDRSVLEAAMSETEHRFEGVEVPRPAHWGGYRVIPESIEFWQGRPNRLHDRLRYRWAAEGWTLDRLSP